MKAAAARACSNTSVDANGQIMIPCERAQGSMGRRRIGQEAFGFDSGQAGRGYSLDRLRALIACPVIKCQLAGIYSAAKGEPARPPPALCWLPATRCQASEPRGELTSAVPTGQAH